MKCANIGFFSVKTLKCLFTWSRHKRHVCKQFNFKNTFLEHKTNVVSHQQVKTVVNSLPWCGHKRHTMIMRNRMNFV